MSCIAQCVLNPTISIGVPDYKGSELEKAIESLQLEMSHRARDLILEHYHKLACKTTKELESTLQQLPSGKKIEDQLTRIET